MDTLGPAEEIGSGSLSVKMPSTGAAIGLSLVITSGSGNTWVAEFAPPPAPVLTGLAVIGALGYIPANDANVVHKTGNETVGGIKTFLDSITTPYITVNSGAANSYLQQSGPTFFFSNYGGVGATTLISQNNTEVLRLTEGFSRFSNPVLSNVSGFGSAFQTLSGHYLRADGYLSVSEINSTGAAVIANSVTATSQYDLASYPSFIAKGTTTDNAWGGGIDFVSNAGTKYAGIKASSAESTFQTSTTLKIVNLSNAPAPLSASRVIAPEFNLLTAGSLLYRDNNVEVDANYAFKVNSPYTEVLSTAGGGVGPTFIVKSQGQTNGLMVTSFGAPLVSIGGATSSITLHGSNASSTMRPSAWGDALLMPATVFGAAGEVQQWFTAPFIRGNFNFVTGNLGGFGWGSSSDPLGVADTLLKRVAAGNVGVYQANGTTLGTFSSGLYIGSTDYPYQTELRSQGYSGAAGNPRVTVNADGLHLNGGYSPGIFIASDVSYSILEIWNKANVKSTNPATCPLTIKGFVTQTANLQEWVTSADAVVASISPTGYFTQRTHSLNNDLGHQFSLVDSVSGIERAFLSHDVAATQFKLISPAGTGTLDIRTTDGGAQFFSNSFAFYSTNPSGNSGFLNYGTGYEAIVNGSTFYFRGGGDAPRILAVAIDGQTTPIQRWLDYNYNTLAEITPSGGAKFASTTGNLGFAVNGSPGNANWSLYSSNVMRCHGSIYGIWLARTSGTGVRWLDSIEIGTNEVGLMSPDANTVEINNGTLGTLRDFRARTISVGGIPSVVDPSIFNYNSTGDNYIRGVTNYFVGDAVFALSPAGTRIGNMPAVGIGDLNVGTFGIHSKGPITMAKVGAAVSYANRGFDFAGWSWVQLNTSNDLVFASYTTGEALRVNQAGGLAVSGNVDLVSSTDVASTQIIAPSNFWGRARYVCGPLIFMGAGPSGEGAVSDGNYMRLNTYGGMVNYSAQLGRNLFWTESYPSGEAVFDCDLRTSGFIAQGYNSITPSARWSMTAAGARQSQVGNGAGVWQTGYREEYNAGGIRCSLYSATPVAQSTGWSVSNYTIKKTFDPTVDNLAGLYNFVCTLAQRVKDLGIIA